MPGRGFFWMESTNFHGFYGWNPQICIHLQVLHAYTWVVFSIICLYSKIKNKEQIVIFICACYENILFDMN